MLFYNSTLFSAEEIEELMSLSSYKSAASAGPSASTSANLATAAEELELFSVRSMDSLNSISCAESFKTTTCKSPPFDEPMEDPFMTPKSSSEMQHFFGDSEHTSVDGGDARAMTPTAMEFVWKRYI